MMHVNDIIAAIESQDVTILRGWVFSEKGLDTIPEDAAAGTTLLSYLLSSTKGHQLFIQFWQEAPDLLTKCNLQAELPGATLPAGAEKNKFLYHMETFPLLLQAAFHAEISRRLQAQSDPTLTDHLVDADVTILKRALLPSLGPRCDRVTSLVIGENTISDRGASELGFLLVNCPAITTFSMKTAPNVRQQGAETFAWIIAVSGLTTAHIDLDMFSRSSPVTYNVNGLLINALYTSTTLTSFNGLNASEFKEDEEEVEHKYNSQQLMILRALRQNYIRTSIYEEQERQVSRIAGELSEVMQSSQRDPFVWRGSDEFIGMLPQLENAFNKLMPIRYYISSRPDFGYPKVQNLQRKILHQIAAGCLHFREYVKLIDMIANSAIDPLAEDILIKFAEVLWRDLGSVDTSTCVDKYQLALLLLETCASQEAVSLRNHIMLDPNVIAALAAINDANMHCAELSASNKIATLLQKVKAEYLFIQHYPKLAKKFIDLSERVVSQVAVAQSAPPPSPMYATASSFFSSPAVASAAASTTLLAPAVPADSARDDARKRRSSSSATSAAKKGAPGKRP